MTDTFEKRLILAADLNPMIPAEHKGRQVYIARQLKTTKATVSKWFLGRAVPRKKMMANLAQVLQVDHAWLSIGPDGEMKPEQKRARSRALSGAANTVLGFFQIANVPCAPPEDDDEEDSTFTAIIRGKKHLVHVLLAEQAEDRIVFHIPPQAEKQVFIGVVPQKHFQAHFLHLDNETLDRAGQPENLGRKITFTKSGPEYKAQGRKLAPLQEIPVIL